MCVYLSDITVAVFETPLFPEHTYLTLYHLVFCICIHTALSGIFKISCFCLQLLHRALNFLKCFSHSFLLHAHIHFWWHLDDKRLSILLKVWIFSIASLLWHIWRNSRSGFISAVTWCQGQQKTHHSYLWGAPDSLSWSFLLDCSPGLFFFY